MTNQNIPILKLMGSFRHPLSTNCGNIPTNHEGEVKGRDVQQVVVRFYLNHCNFETTSDINEESGLSCEKVAVDAAFRAFLGPHQPSQSACTQIKDSLAVPKLAHANAAGVPTDVTRNSRRPQISFDLYCSSIAREHWRNVTFVRSLDERPMN